ncbi:hypothetical protein DP61_5597 [Burkholderia pseudomallei]|nr:hypothetical protein DP61_5597 [Burkholderia pseudomallei]KGD10953.1 hypothetical protein DO70_2538 [Burkholderia pseudomallei]KGR93347.1 hypothetical protein X948_5559 [Burkholderia pseudomallei MSHR5608]
MTEGAPKSSKVRIFGTRKIRKGERFRETENADFKPGLARSIFHR